MDMSIVDKGILYEAKPVVREKYHRMTKQELHDFVRWMFTHVNDDGWNEMSCRRIANMYYQETGKYICHQTVARNRDNWYIKGGKIVRVD